MEKLHKIKVKATPVYDMKRDCKYWSQRIKHILINEYSIYSIYIQLIFIFNESV